MNDSGSVEAKQFTFKGLSPATSEAMYGGLVATLPAIVYVAEPSPPYSTIYVSPNISCLGYTLDEWWSRPDFWVSILHPVDREWVLQQSAAAMSSGAENDFEYRVLARDGSTRWLHDVGRFVRDAEQQPLYWQGVMLDVTARKEAAQERERLIAELQMALAQVKTLRRLLPICSYCKSVRDDKAYWQALDEYVTQHTDTKFSHGVCPDCYENLVQPQLRRIKQQIQPL